MKHPHASNMTRHAPVTVTFYDRDLRRDRGRIMYGENLCGAPSYPGCTTALDCLVSCPKCVELKEAK